MIGYYNYTVILTYVGTLFGLAGIACMIDGGLKAALVCLMAAGLCDMLDGRIASTMVRTRQEKRFGVQIDSLSDLVCFGVLPALIVFQCSDGQLPHAAISAAYVLCAVIRLAWFNVDEEERQDHEEDERKTYLGLPVTAAALAIPLLMGVTGLLNLPSGVIGPWVLLVIAAAFVSPFSLRKPKTLGKIVVVLCGLATFALVMVGV